MPYCPECLTEYVEGTLDCEDCGVTLRWGSPPARATVASELDESPDVKLVRIRTFSGPTGQLNADLARNLLQAQAISCILAGAVAAVFDIPLLVREEDAGRAIAILQSYLDTPEPD